MGLFDIFKSKKKLEEEQAMNLFKALIEHQSTMRADSVDSDSLLINAGCDYAITNNEDKTAIQCVEVEWGERHHRTWGILLAASDRRSIEAVIAEPAMACRGRRI